MDPSNSSPRRPDGVATAAIAGRSGFSLVELFVVLVVISILVALSIPRYHDYKHRYYLSTMVSDLRNLAITEEAYWNDVGTYSIDLHGIRFTNAPDVSITMVSADTMGWSARASYSGDTAICAIYYGAAPVLSPATLKNIIGCTP